MKKVLFVATVTKHINAFHIPYLKMLKENGYEVHVASNGNEPIKYCDKHYSLDFARFPLKLQNYKVYKELKKIINENNYEIIHCHTPVGGVLARLAAKNARKNGTRVMYTAHGFHFYKGAPLLNWLIYYPIEKWLSKYTDCLITINQEDYERAKKKLKKCKQIELVHGVGLDTTKFDIEITEEELEKLRKEIGINKENIILTYVAELNKNKNQILLIKTIKELIKENDNYRLVLVGDGKKRIEYEQYIKKYNLEKYVKLLGKRTDIPQILKLTNIYVASSLREGLPVNILEAMYMGLPVVATDNRGHREVVMNDKNGALLNENAFNEIRREIKYTNDNFKKIKDKYKKNKSEYTKIYTLENVIEKMKKVYWRKNED